MVIRSIHSSLCLKSRAFYLPNDTMEPPPLPDFPPEYINESNAGRIIALVGVFHFIALIFVTLRVYVRVFMVRAFGIDDGLIIIACVSARTRLSSWFLYSIADLGSN